MGQIKKKKVPHKIGQREYYFYSNIIHSVIHSMQKVIHNTPYSFNTTKQTFD